MSEQSSPAAVSQLRARFLGQAATAFDRMFGADGQNGLVSFDQRERRACEVTDELARWLMATHVSLDPAVQVGAEGACPICGGPVRYESAEQAKLEVRAFATCRGPIDYERAACRCPRCRRIFFPAG